MNQNDADRMMQLITGYWVTQVVHAAATFSIADHPAKSPATAQDIADAEGTDPSATFRLLRTCASLGLVKYAGDSRFAGTSLLDTQRKDNPRSLRAIAVSWPLPGHWLPWGRFAEAVRTGKSQTVLAAALKVLEAEKGGTQPAGGSAGCGGISHGPLQTLLRQGRPHGRRCESRLRNVARCPACC